MRSHHPEAADDDDYDGRNADDERDDTDSDTDDVDDRILLASRRTILIVTDGGAASAGAGIIFAATDTVEYIGRADSRGSSQAHGRDKQPEQYQHATYISFHGSEFSQHERHDDFRA